MPASPRLLLVQVREEPDIAAHERTCIADLTGLDAAEFDWVNLAMTGLIDWGRVLVADAVVVGGSGEHSATEDYAYTDAAIEFVRRCAREEVPLFGSCWGHQFIARALGGSVIHDPEHAEVGVADVRLTPAGADDPVLADLPTTFPALMGHLDRVVELPPGATELIESARCPNQAFRVDGKPIYATQFHAELTPRRLVERLAMYPKYLGPDDDLERMERMLPPTPDASQILGRFLERFARHR